MRFIASGIFIVLGIVLGGLGILQKTVWAPSDTITATASVSTDAEAVVIEPGVLNLYDTPATLKVNGEGPITVSQASKENIDAWVGDDGAAQRIGGLSSQTKLNVSKPDGKGTLPDPAGGDLFTSQAKGDDSVNLKWDKDAGRTAFLISGEGKAGTVKSVSITWPHHTDTPWATALIVLGIIALAAGIVLGLLGLNKRRKDKLRRERRQERRRKLAKTGSADAETGQIEAVGTVASAHAVASEAAAATGSVPVVDDSAPSETETPDGATAVLPPIRTQQPATDSTGSQAKPEPSTDKGAAVQPDKPGDDSLGDSLADKTDESEAADSAESEHNAESAATDEPADKTEAATTTDETDKTDETATTDKGDDADTGDDSDGDDKTGGGPGGQVTKERDVSAPPKPTTPPNTPGTTARRAHRSRLFRPLGALALVPALALAGCGGDEELPKAQPASAPSTAPAVVTDDQVATLLDKVGGQIKTADGKLNTGALKKRATGPALEQRTTAYKYKKKAKKDYDMPPAVANAEVVRNVSSATSAWPRVTTVVAKGDKQTQVLVLSQKSPRDSYKLWSQATLLGGAEIPKVNDSRQGSELLDPDAKGFSASPKKMLNDYARVLSGSGKKAKAAKKKFADDAFVKQIQDSQKKQKKSLKSGNASAEFSYDAGKSLTAQATTDGALVMGTVTETTTIKPESKEGQTGKLSISKPQSEIVGETSSSKSLQQKVTYNVVFNLPKSGDAKLLGVSGLMTDAKLT